MTPNPSRIALLYLLVGSLWIVISDWLLAALAPTGFVMGQTIKGFMFVAAGAGVLHVLARRVRREQHGLEQERIRLERRLGAVARLEAIGRLTGSIAHDFNNLLTAISGNIEAYVSEHPEREQTSEELREIRRSADRAADLTRQLLAFGRPQHDQPQPVDMNETIRNMSALLNRLIGNRVRIRMDLAGDLSLVHADPGRLEQMVMNLALNARDAMPEGGELLLRTRNEDDDFTRLDVIDTGIGISPELEARIFEPYFTTKSPGAGTGLGLPTVDSIVKQYGGRITVTSEPGAGAAFHVFLRRTAAPGSASPQSDRPLAHPLVGGGTETVLVAEDDAAVRSLVARVLRRCGFAVHEAAGGREALELLGHANSKIDILIADAMMPDMTGMELINATRPINPELRTLMISGYPAEDFATTVPYLGKPFTSGQLVARIREVLDR